MAWPHSAILPLSWTDESFGLVRVVVAVAAAALPTERWPDRLKSSSATAVRIKEYY